MRALGLVPFVLGLFVLGLSGCGGPQAKRCLSGEWPQLAEDYEATTDAWTSKTGLRDQYQEILELAGTFKSPQWRAARANRDAYFRGVEGAAREQLMTQAHAETAGPYEVELMVTTWDRRENDLDRGKKSVWHIALVDEQGNEIEPLEIVKDKRPAHVIRADFPAFGEFATGYIARFPNDPSKPVLGASSQRVRLRMSSPRGGVWLTWTAQANACRAGG